MKKKECPSCAMEVEAKSKVCPICGYEFPAYSPAMKWTAILLVAAFLLTWLFSVIR
jgi:RNA polymerase subunit RPABC4/transcription elongation factor Spt4